MRSQVQVMEAQPLHAGGSGRALGATRYDHQQERGFDFWVLRDPWGNEFCVLHPNFPELLARRGHGPARACLQCHSSYSTLAAMVA
jgi:Glyoxalase-like domain